LKQTSLAKTLLALTTGIVISISSLPAIAQQSAAHGKLDELIKKGDDLYKAGKFKEAIDAYKEALGHDPNSDQAVAYIGYSYNKLRDSKQARLWMRRRIEIPGQTPSRKAQVLTDITLLLWDEAHMDIATRLASGKASRSEDSAAAKTLLAEGIDSAQKAVAIAPRSVKGFNLLNLLYRASAATESDSSLRSELLGKADEALRRSVELFEAAPVRPSTDLWAVPTLSAINGTDLQSVHFGSATKKPSPDAMRAAKEGAVVVEVVVGTDGKVRLPRVLAGSGRLGEAALGAAQQWEFEPTMFEGHVVQVIETISFPAK
jgi:TonB family protein